MVKVGVIKNQYSVPYSSLGYLKHCQMSSDQVYQELLYADGLVLIAESMEELIQKFKKWKEGMDTRGHWINMKKTKTMISDFDTESERSSGRWS